MTTYKMTGQIEKVMDAQVFASGFTKREFVLLVADKFEQHVKFTLTKDKCALLDDVVLGDEVKVTFGIIGREWQGKYFVDLQAFAVSASNSESSEHKDKDYQPPVSASNSFANTGNDDEDLPF